MVMLTFFVVMNVSDNYRKLMLFMSRVFSNTGKD